MKFLIICKHLKWLLVLFFIKRELFCILNKSILWCMALQELLSVLCNHIKVCSIQRCISGERYSSFWVFFFLSFFFLEYLFLWTFEVWVLITISTLLHKSEQKALLSLGWVERVLWLWGGLWRSPWNTIMLVMECWGVDVKFLNFETRGGAGEVFPRIMVFCSPWYCIANRMEDCLSFAYKTPMLLWIPEETLRLIVNRKSSVNNPLHK